MTYRFRGLGQRWCDDHRGVPHGGLFLRNSKSAGAVNLTVNYGVPTDRWPSASGYMYCNIAQYLSLIHI